MRLLFFGSKTLKIKKSDNPNLAVKHKLLKPSLLGMLATCLIMGVLSWSGIGHAQGSIEITGTVTDPSGNGVADVSVYATDPGTDNVDYGPTMTASDGTYTLDVNAGTYDFHFDPASGSGYNSVVDSGVAVTSGQTINVQFSAATYSISGTIEDSQGNPMTVNDLNIDLYSPSGQLITSAGVNNSSQYSIAAVPGVYKLEISGYDGGSLPDEFDVGFTPTFDMTAGNVTKNIQFDMEQVQVTVDDVNGNPVSGASVYGTDTGNTTVFAGDTTPVSATGTSTNTTDSDGTTTLPAFVGTTYAAGALCASPPNGGQPVCNTTPLTVSGDTSITLTQFATYSISGTIEDSQGNPMTVNDLNIDLYSPSGQLITSAGVNNSSQYSIAAVPGVYKLEISGYDGGSLPDEFDVGFTPTFDMTAGNVTKNIQFDMEQVQVTVDDVNGNPVSGASVYGTDTGNTTVFAGDTTPVSATGTSTNTTDSDGTTTLPAFVGTTYAAGALCASPPNGGQPVCNTTPLTVSGDTSITLTQFATYSISGTIEDSQGNPMTVNDLNIDLYSPSGQLITSAGVNNSSQYSIAAVPGVYKLEISGYDGGSLPDEFDVGFTPTFDMTAGNVTKNIQFDMEQVQVTVDDVNGNPVSGASVYGTDTGNTTVFAGDTTPVSATGTSTNTTDSDGTTTLPAFVGTTYAAGALCASPPNGGQPVCNTTPLTVSGDTAIIFQGNQAITFPSAPTNLTIPSPTTAPVLTWNASSGAASYNIYANGNLIGNTTTTTYTDNSPTLGSDTYYVTAVNSGGESGPSNIVNVEVVSPPAITSNASYTVNARNPANFTVTTTGFPTPGITESGSLPTGITFTDNGDGTATFFGQASPINQGYYFITLTASSSAGTTSQSFILTTTDYDEAPTIISANNVTATYDVPFSFTVDTTGYPLPKITKTKCTASGYSAPFNNIPAGVKLTDNGDGTATLTGQLDKNSDQGGTYCFTINASNNQGTATPQEFYLTINENPVIANITNKKAAVGDSYTQTVSATGNPTPSLSMSGLPSGLSFTDNGNGTGTVSGTPQTGSGGVYTVTLTAVNSQGSSATTYMLTVDEAPSITSNNSATATVGSPFSFQVTATGYPSPNLNETGKLPKGVTFTNSTGAFSGAPDSGTTGTYPVTITAKNSQGTYTQSFVLNVN